MYERLVAYQKHYQNTLVPHRFTEDPSLGHWISIQRWLYNKGDLLEGRIDFAYSWINSNSVFIFLKFTL